MNVTVEIPFRRELEFEYGRVDLVSPPGAVPVRRVVARNPSAFTLYGTGTYIVGRGRVAVIDPGPGPPRPRRVPRRRRRRRGGEPHPRHPHPQ